VIRGKRPMERAGARWNKYEIQNEGDNNVIYFVNSKGKENVHPLKGMILKAEFIVSALRFSQR
jgi:hypothetical protein